MNRGDSGTRRPMLVSFSGIDGAGKSTQIGILHTRLRVCGVRVLRVVFWDEVAVLTRFRAFTSHALFKGDQGIGTPANPLNRRDKNVRCWYMTPLRFFLYFLDAVSVTFVVAKMLRSNADVVIFDRYVYDELANLSPNDPITRAYIRFLLALIPSLDIAYLLDADPVQARERKPEYPLEFLQVNRASYLALSQRVGVMRVINPLSPPDVARHVMDEMSKNLTLGPGQTMLQASSTTSLITVASSGDS